jgi:ankyrin repeat protein
MNIKDIIRRLSYSIIPLIGAILLVVLAWSTTTFCGEIHDAAKIGNLVKVKELLKDNPDIVFSKDNKDMTPLHWAAVMGKKPIAELLLDNKADINVKTNEGFTPLHMAAGNTQKDIVELLLAKGADVNAKNKKGLTPLHCAAGETGDIVELLLAKRADVNAKTKKWDSLGLAPGMTPLHMAAHDGSRDIAKLLITYKAEVNARNDIGWTPLHEAADRCYKDMVKLLLANKADINAKEDLFKHTPLHRAVMCLPNQQKEVVALLLDKGADVKSKDKSGETPLQLGLSFDDKLAKRFRKHENQNRGN